MRGDARVARRFLEARGPSGGVSPCGGRNAPFESGGQEVALAPQRTRRSLLLNRDCESFLANPGQCRLKSYRYRKTLPPLSHRTEQREALLHPQRGARGSQMPSGDLEIGSTSPFAVRSTAVV